MVSQGKKISRSNYNPLLGPRPRDNFWDAVGSVYGRSGVITGTGGCFQSPITSGAEAKERSLAEYKRNRPWLN